MNDAHGIVQLQPEFVVQTPIGPHACGVEHEAWMNELDEMPDITDFRLNAVAEARATFLGYLQIMGDLDDDAQIHQLCAIVAFAVTPSEDALHPFPPHPVAPVQTPPDADEIGEVILRLIAIIEGSDDWTTDDFLPLGDVEAFALRANSSRSVQLVKNLSATA